eukprot:m.39242 g.39242  ORF g.39242 m.39242 type:complete len:342 (+) comp5771_c0_seq1:505-1530(+)
MTRVLSSLPRTPCTANSGWMLCNVGMSFFRPGKGRKPQRLGGNYFALEELGDCLSRTRQSENYRCARARVVSVNRLTYHAVDRAGQRDISQKELAQIQRLARVCVRKEEKVVTATGTTAVVRDGAVVTVYRKDGLGSLPHVETGNAVNIPKRFLDRRGREKIHKVESKLSCPGLSICHIHVPSRIAPGDPVLVPLAVAGAPVDMVQRELEVALGPWKVVDDVLPALIVGRSGKTIRLLHTLVPGCTIYPANKDAMYGDEQDKRTVLRGAPEHIEVAHTLIRKLHEHRTLAACPKCGESFEDLKKGRKHARRVHAADGITDEMMREAGFDRLGQLLADFVAE